MSRLVELQIQHATNIAQLIMRLNLIGYGVVGEEWKRTKEQAALNAKNGSGISNSLHLDKLATDLSLFKGGKYLTKTEDYKVAGDIWKSLDPLCRWGGDWKVDGNHFSTAFMGRK